MKIFTKNKKASFDYDITTKYTTGIVLAWHEVKSVKTGHINITDTIISLQKGELRLLGMDIPLYAKTSPHLVPGYQPKRKRKLLVTKRELAKIASAMDKPSIVALALEVFSTQSGFIKINIWLGKLRKKIEKKQILKERSIEKEMRTEARNV